MGKKDVQIKYPNNYRGIAKTTTNEDTQEELFLPTENILIAVNAEGDVEMGTVVVDLDKDNNMDGDRAARLQSAFRVIKYPEGADTCAIALQLGPSGKKDTHGYFADRKAGTAGENQTVVLEGKWAFAKGSYLEGGPFDVGTGNCEHKVGEDDEGNPISKLHISTKALFRKNDKLDGPLKFEDELPPPNKNLDQRIDVHLSWDTGNKVWYWWTTSPLSPLSWVPTLGPQTPGEIRPTTYPTYPKVNITPTINPTSTTGTNTVATKAAAVKTPGGLTTGLSPAEVAQIGTEGSWADGETPSQRAARETEEWMRANGLISNNVVSAENQNPMNLMASLSPLAMPAMAFRPQNYTTGQVETGVFSPPNSQSKAKANNAPITAIASAFGAQGGNIPAANGYGPSETGASGDPWNYNQWPKKSKAAGKKNSKYLGGTSNGGIVFHPPETDLRDASSGLAPAGVTLSTTYIMTSPGAYFGCGVPQLVNGSIKDGFSWGSDLTTGDWLLRSHANSQPPVEAFRVTRTSQNIRWMSALTFYGEFDHANTANRTYTFPDKSGTVALTTDVTGSQQVGLVTGDVNIASNTTLADVAGLTIALGATESWAIRVDLDIGAALATTGGKFAITVPSGATVAIEAQLFGVVPGTAKTYGLRSITGGAALDFTAANLASQTDGRVSIMVYVLTTGAGNVTVQAAQSTSSLTNLTIRMGSQIVGTKKS